MDIREVTHSCNYIKRDTNNVIVVYKIIFIIYILVNQYLSNIPNYPTNTIHQNDVRRWLRILD